MKKALFVALVSLGLAQAAFADPQSTVGLITSGTSTVGAIATVLGNGYSVQSANVTANTSMSVGQIDPTVGEEGKGVAAQSVNNVVASVSGKSEGVAPMQGPVGFALVSNSAPVANGAFALGAFTTTSFGAIGSIPAVIPTSTANLYSHGE